MRSTFVTRLPLVALLPFVAASVAVSLLATEETELVCRRDGAGAHCVRSVAGRAEEEATIAAGERVVAYQFRGPRQRTAGDHTCGLRIHGGRHLMAAPCAEMNAIAAALNSRAGEGLVYRHVGRPTAWTYALAALPLLLGVLLALFTWRRQTLWIDGDALVVEDHRLLRRRASRHPLAGVEGVAIREVPQGRRRLFALEIARAGAPTRLVTAPEAAYPELEGLRERLDARLNGRRG